MLCGIRSPDKNFFSKEKVFIVEVWKKEVWSG